SLGWAARHHDQLDGIVLTNTAIHQPAGSRAPGLIRAARLPVVLDVVCVQTPGFIQAALELSRPRLPKGARDGYHAPYRTSPGRSTSGSPAPTIPRPRIRHRRVHRRGPDSTGAPRTATSRWWR